MKILLTGANGYIGQRLLPVLLEQGHTVYCCVRNRRRFNGPTHENFKIIEVDFLDPAPGTVFPADLDVAFFLIHSMSSKGDFAEKEARTAEHFSRLVSASQCRQIIYLSGIVNEDELSEHLSSRFEVEKILRSGKVPVTVLRAGIIVGSGSASFEIIRDLVEKLPVMVAPKWLNTLCQPIGIRNVIQFLSGVMGRENTYDHDFDIGGPDVLTYQQMLLKFAEVRGLRRFIVSVPVMTPKLSSYWLYFITSTSYHLAQNLVDSMKINVICRPNNLAAELGIELMSYKTAVELAFRRIEQHMVVSSWKDAFSSFDTNPKLMEYVEVPRFGVFKDEKSRIVTGQEPQVLDRIWSIGGQQGWYYGDFLWKIRGLLDRMVGGVGLRRGRTHSDQLHPGDSLDFWRVLIADRAGKRLLLYAEMKLPGEAWLEFCITEKAGESVLTQTATFRPRGLWGRLYWLAMLPFHFFLFGGMVGRLGRV
ncbi:MAG: SDR family oxidoreductase [Saprospiraceae bacterium]|nr:SDR family oxidoreductase [Saprospiraceae bacterium]MCF8250002.1 SDR family oxidoreductase [Saprospiraceae bacterium]MCF8278958.1 SDR family oxidoreductase [Bacteroidales bacterium]MCF8311015.1 SDR family oxidoreductase [Saprospiraceae bacterium]MCF8439649.1 SDR family oxidoreductase [Saprospiraceae bacterium]